MHERLPLFPLGTVLYPGLMLPLHIFEPRYRALVADLAPDGAPGGVFGVVAIRAGHEVGVDALPALHPIGCATRIRDVETLPDGRFDLVTSGTRRFRLHEVDPAGAYLVGEVEWLPDEPGEASPALCATVGRAYRAYREQLLNVAGQVPRTTGPMPDDPVVLSYLVAAAMLLEAPDAAERLRAALRLLHRERGILDRIPSVPSTELLSGATSPN
ncbi:MAG: LON peptidase substrate-binding domain-containing protein [Actinobacteria bacterium]|nr:LON peptidase substrate-binding domain-containing protein [Actinomycetota bacterium]